MWPNGRGGGGGGGGGGGRGLRTCFPWAFVCVGDFQSVEEGEELAVSCSQYKDRELRCSA